MRLEAKPARLVDGVKDDRLGDHAYSARPGHSFRSPGQSERSDGLVSERSVSDWSGQLGSLSSRDGAWVSRPFFFLREVPFSTKT